MIKTMAWTLAIALVLAVLLVLAHWSIQRQLAERIAITSHRGIASLEKVRLGGADQWILIRGWDRTKPLLLFVHGGPGFPEMPFAHLNAALEEDFVVVQWDQRGAGESYPAPNASLDVEQFVSDTRELSDLLLKRFGAEKLFVVGHSWGSLLGALSAARDPDKFFCYVGISQFADASESERIVYRFALEQAERTSNARASSELKQIGLPPYESMRDFRTMKRCVPERHGPHVDREEWTVKFPPTVVADFAGKMKDVAKIVGVSDDLDVVANCEAAVREQFASAVHSKQSNPRGEPDPAVSAARSQPYYLDGTHPQANKGAVVLSLSKMLGIPAEQMATLGDMPNDISMFTKSGISIAMGQSSEEVKKAATYVSTSAEEEGLANAIERYVLAIARTSADDVMNFGG